MNAALAVIAKAPAPGRTKTRLCPPLSPLQATMLAEAALADTLAVVSATSARRKILVLDGRPGRWTPAGFELIAQRGAGLDERLANAFTDIGEAGLIIGMDTPQLTPELLDRGLELLAVAGAVLGPASDGGYWGIGLRQPDPRALVGVPMSTCETLSAQRSRLQALGVAVAQLECLCDVDTFEDAVRVAALAPGTRFAAKLAELVPVSAAA